MKNNKKTHISKNGFSLIELAVILTIAASFIIGYISLTANPAKNYASNDYLTKQKLEKIASSIEFFRLTQNRLPCPSNITAPENDSTNDRLFDDENIVGDQCQSNIGSVPTRALGLPANYMLDSWGRRIKYHVSSNLCSNVANGCTAARYESGTGDLVISNSTSTVSSSAAYILLSHGLNGLGAYMPSGAISNIQQTILDNASLNIAEKTNANTSVNYIQDTISKEFDDILLFRTKNQIEFLRIDTETKIVTEEICQQNAQELSAINISQTIDVSGTLRNEITETQKNDGANNYNFGDTAAINIMMGLQEICLIYYPSLTPVCPGGGIYDQETNTCICTNGTWSGSCS